MIGDSEILNSLIADGAQRTPAEQSWRNALTHCSSDFIQDAHPRGDRKPVYCSSEQHMNNIWQMSHTLLATGHDGRENFRFGRTLNPKWREEWEKSEANQNDRLAIVDLFGRIRARREMPEGSSQALKRMSDAQVDYWWRNVIGQAWNGVTLPSWMNDQVGAEVQEMKKFNGHSRYLYRPWTDNNNGQDLHGDVVQFFTAFLKERPVDREDKIDQAGYLSKGLLLLRALAVHDSNRMPASTMVLVDHMEQCLSPSCLRRAYPPKSTQVIWAAWDRHVLSDAGQDAENQNASRFIDRRPRTL